MQEKTIGLIGAGQMARALSRGFVDAGVVDARHLIAADAVPAAVAALIELVPGAQAERTNVQLVERSNVIFLAVKPQKLGEVFEQLAGTDLAGKLFVSIAAGVSLASLSTGLGTDRIVRVMPNTPCLVGKSASAFCRGPGATDDDAALVSRLLRSLGVAVELDEHLLDAVTGLSGSGPAFVYVMIEAMSDAGVRAGLPRDVATVLAAQTVSGAAEMVLRTGDHPGVLKDRVASPAGTTIAGLQALEAGGVRAALMSAVEAATARSRELGQA